MNRQLTVQGTWPELQPAAFVRPVADNAVESSNQPFDDGAAVEHAHFRPRLGRHTGQFGDCGTNYLRVIRSLSGRSRYLSLSLMTRPGVIPAPAHIEK